MHQTDGADAQGGHATWIHTESPATGLWDVRWD